MTAIDKEVARAITNLNSISKTAVPRAGAQAINRVTKRVITHAIRDTSKDIAVTQKIIRKRVKQVKAKATRPVSFINLRRGDIPAISIGTARTQIKREGGNFLAGGSRRNSRGQFSKREHSGNTSIRVGRHVFKNAFLQKLKNGRWHIMERSSEARYPIKVASIPLAVPMTRRFKAHSQNLIYTDLPKELRSALKQQLRLIIKRR
ncbi:MAG: phage tail protein [Bermanella sp.]|jgi:Prophage minor tail protein Z (GPZ).